MEIHLLVIEDNPADFRLVQVMLEGCESPSFSIVHACLLEEGLETLAAGCQDALLLDIGLPDSRGLEGLERILAAHPALPVVILTGADDESLGMDAISRGASDYLVKGAIETNLLVRSLRYAMERKRLEAELRESEDKLRRKNTEMEADLHIAQVVQRKFLRQRFGSSDRITIEYRHLPHSAVGGDFFSFTPLHEGGLGVFVGDVVGHGISAALFLSLLKSATDRACRAHGTEPGQYMRLLNDELLEYMDFNFITAVYGHLRFFSEGAEFTFSNAGHPMPALYRRSSRKAQLLGAAGTILGALPDRHYEESTVRLDRGDRIFLYTDGIPEARNGKGGLIGFDEMSGLVEGADLPDLSETLDLIMKEVYSHIGEYGIDDDIVLIGIEIR